MGATTAGECSFEGSNRTPAAWLREHPHGCAINSANDALPCRASRDVRGRRLCVSVRLALDWLKLVGLALDWLFRGTIRPISGGTLEAVRW
jgi:hypothetical protein